MPSYTESFNERCYARVGIMGNPSDGFEGKTVSALIGNFYASCSISPSGSNKIKLVPHPKYDPTTYESLDDLYDHSAINGYYGGMRLLQATCRVFFDYLLRSGLKESILGTNDNDNVKIQDVVAASASAASGGDDDGGGDAGLGFIMSYDTNIPRCVGLSGSSAIIVCAFRCLLKFHGNLKLSDLGIAKDVFPSIILSIEKSELKISAGLQDRVIQTYGGLVHMDFTPISTLSRAPSDIDINMNTLTGLKPGGVYTSYSPDILPSFYLAYNTKLGGESGAVHNTVKDRWEKRDSTLISCMQELGSYADQCIQDLLNKNHQKICILMKKNFAMRRRIYGDDVVGAKNIEVVKLAERMGLAAKFTGSGGAILCLRYDDETGAGVEKQHDSYMNMSGTFYEDVDQENTIKREFLAHGYEFVRIQPVPVEESVEVN